MYESCQEPLKIPRVAIVWLSIETIESPSLEREELVVGEKVANPFLDTLVSPGRHTYVIERPGSLQEAQPQVVPKWEKW